MTDVKSGTIQAGGDAIIGLCGLTSSVLTAAILSVVARTTGIVVYGWMLWFIVPVGAILSGCAGASGYVAGAWLFGRRPSRLLLFNVVAAAVATFFLVHYLNYISLDVQGRHVSAYIGFLRYLDLAIESSSMRFGPLATGAFGKAGYVLALLQIAGFSLGGVVAYAYLDGQALCEHCSHYMSMTKSHERYTDDSAALTALTERVHTLLGAGQEAAALEAHRDFGEPLQTALTPLRSSLTVFHCRHCDRDWLRYRLEALNGPVWVPLEHTTINHYVDHAER